ncbi:hypothetical protein EHB95_16995 [Salmonella enterica subsp. enterica serovar Oslo]|uniref:Uncharacterized protein n=1 Tax=Salmonella enterica subsp. enterica serovar Oslo TaxID=1005394 RepID=A0A732F659_SALET|nr:hypothetical protein [Salmonella enterica]AXD88576.1 hypothetical protein CHD10_23555 [Salmonella enterica]EBZ8672542.1 hypothetical protein [Salmonella enterica subsp. enterica serovar Oslo]HAE4845450.1 hypothetical protein [Salmonella enterica subsp. enterica serovar Oslo]HAE8024780.1 hypothetical protein [Salmonella enterica subsp. enterica serovar Oslo]
MLGGADNPNGELPSYIIGADIAPETALPAHLTVCKATAPDGAVNPSAATPAACFPLWTFRGLE